MAAKYLKGGALNPAWCDEQDAKLEAEYIMESMGLLYNIFNNMAMDFNLQLGEGVSVNVSNRNNKEPKNMCTIVENDYEAKFNFLKNHSATPEDLQLAKEIIGLK